MLISAATMSNMTVLDAAVPFDLDMSSSEAVYPISFQVPLLLDRVILRFSHEYLPPRLSFCQVSLTGFLILEIVLGLSSNLTVLVLYCMKQNLISSVSNIITMNLHVVDVMVSPDGVLLVAGSLTRISIMLS